MAIQRSLLNVLKQNYALDWHGIHGVAHWARVRLNGLLVARETGADQRVVEYFAFIHDSCREDEHRDLDHGIRAIQFAKSIRRDHIALDDAAFDLLLEAISDHTTKTHHSDSTVAACWDADRLDLSRVGIYPDPALLNTQPAKRSNVIQAASARAEHWVNRWRASHLYQSQCSTGLVAPVGVAKPMQQQPVTAPSIFSSERKADDTVRKFKLAAKALGAAD